MTETTTIHTDETDVEIIDAPALVQPEQLTLANNGKHEMTTFNSTITQQGQEFLAGIHFARAFPRDEGKALSEILAACKRPSFAQKALYTLPGKVQVTDVGIKLAEFMVQKWGNLKTGVRVIDYGQDQSRWEAFCVDLQTMAWTTAEFVVKHGRYSKAGGFQKLLDPNEVTRIVNAMASKMKRNCITKTIPTDVVDAAKETCLQTLKAPAGKTKDEPLGMKVSKMLSGFRNKFDVTGEMIEKQLAKKTAEINEQDLAYLRGIYSALESGEAQKNEYFELPEVKEPE